MKLVASLFALVVTVAIATASDNGSSGFTARFGVKRNMWKQLDGVTEATRSIFASLEAHKVLLEGYTTGSLHDYIQTKLRPVNFFPIAMSTTRLNLEGRMEDGEPLTEVISKKVFGLLSLDEICSVLTECGYRQTNTIFMYTSSTHAAIQVFIKQENVVAKLRNYVVAHKLDALFAILAKKVSELSELQRIRDRNGLSAHLGLFPIFMKAIIYKKLKDSNNHLKYSFRPENFFPLDFTGIEFDENTQAKIFGLFNPDEILCETSSVHGKEHIPSGSRLI